MLQLLLAVAMDDRGVTLTDAAARVGLSASTTLRQLRSLEAAGLLRRDEDQRYVPGAQLTELSRRVFIGESLVAAAQPELDVLSRATGESAYLAVARGGDHAVYLASAPGAHALRHSGWLGREFPRADTAVDDALHGRLDADGVCVRDGSLEPGITAISAPVTTASGVVGALSVVGPSFRLVGGALRAARREVGASTRRLSATLGVG